MKESAMSNNGESPRLDRIEKIVEALAIVRRDIQQQRQHLFRPQVAQADEIQQLKKQIELNLQALAASEQRRDDALKALMRTVDQFLRKN